MEMAQAAQAARDPADHGRRADARRRHPPHAPVRDARGLHEPLPHAHRLALAHRRWAREGWAEGGGRQDPLDGEPSISLEDARARTPTGSCACRAARATARVAARVERAGATRRPRPRPAGSCGAFGPDRFRVELQRPFCAPRPAPQPPAAPSWPSGWGCPCVATGNVHVHARERIAAPGRDGRGRGSARRSTRRSPQRRGNSSHVLAPPERMAERFREHPDAVQESGRLAERLAFDLTEDLGYRYPGSEDPDADRKLAELCARPLRRALRAAAQLARRRRGSTRSCA